jgi:hypothetical protein
MDEYQLIRLNGQLSTTQMVTLYLLHDTKNKFSLQDLYYNIKSYQIAPGPAAITEQDRMKLAKTMPKH